ncbi:hypothetical protein [Streptomyces sp. NPDC001667]
MTRVVLDSAQVQVKYVANSQVRPPWTGRTDPMDRGKPDSKICAFCRM